MTMPTLSEVAEIYPDSILALSEIYGNAPICLYRGTHEAEGGVGLYWTPNPEAAADYAAKIGEQGLVKKITLLPENLECWVMPYIGKHWSYQHFNGEVELESLANATLQREALQDEGYEMDVILVADDLSYRGRQHDSFLIVSGRALQQVSVDIN